MRNVNSFLEDRKWKKNKWSSQVVEAETKYPEEILMRGQFIELLEPPKVSGIGDVRHLLWSRGYNQRARLLYFLWKKVDFRGSPSRGMKHREEKKWEVKIKTAIFGQTLKTKWECNPTLCPLLLLVIQTLVPACQWPHTPCLWDVRSSFQEKWKHSRKCHSHAIYFGNCLEKVSFLPTPSHLTVKVTSPKTLPPVF